MSIKRGPALLFLIISLLTPVFAREPEDHTFIVTGPGVGTEFSCGLIGVFASVNSAVFLPKINDRFQIGFRGSWSMPATTIAHMNADSTEVVSYLPWMVYGSVFMHLGPPVIKDIFRPYFGLELLAGSTFATQDNFIGDNVTLGLIPYVGTELYAKQSLAIFLEAGISAVFTLTDDNTTELGTMTQHGGTGFFIRIGPRFYFGKR